MVKNIDYDFSKIDNPDQEKEEDPRANYCITRCCGNCTNFWYKSSKPRRGFCKLPNPKEKSIYKPARQRYNEAEIRKNWLKTHITNSCDQHRFRSKWFSIGLISEWVGFLFDMEGNIIEEDE